MTYIATDRRTNHGPDIDHITICTIQGDINLLGENLIKFPLCESPVNHNNLLKLWDAESYQLCNVLV